MGTLGGHNGRACLFADSLTCREHVDKPRGNHNRDKRRHHRNDEHIALGARLAMTPHMSALNCRVGRASARGIGVANIIGAHHLGKAGVHLRHVYRMGLVGGKRIHDARCLRVGCLGRGIAGGGIADLVGRSREHLLVHLRRYGGNHRSHRRTDKRPRHADHRRQHEHRSRRQGASDHLGNGKILEQGCQFPLFRNLLCGHSSTPPYHHQASSKGSVPRAIHVLFTHS